MGFPNNKITNGLSGGRYIGDSNTYTGDWLAIQVLSASKFHTLEGNLTAIANTTEGSAPIIPAGTTLFGKFTSARLHAGGAVIVYTA